MRLVTRLLSIVSAWFLLISAGCAPSSVIPQGENHPAVPTSEPGVVRPVSKTLMIGPDDLMATPSEKGDEMKGDEMKGDEMKGDEMKGDEMKGDEMKGDEMKGHEMKDE